MIGKSFRFETAEVSHTGLARDHNEDRVLSEPESGLWLVADGMGGHQRGDYASGMIVDTLRSIGRPTSAPDLQARFVDRLNRANDQIHAFARTNGATIGSTVVALLAYQQHFACVWSGDSRAYLVRDGNLSPMSRDHTEANELLDRGAITEEEAENWPRKNVITRAIGVGAEVRLDHTYGTLRPKDTFILCSDGLTAHVSDLEILEMAQRGAPQQACKAMLDLTLERGATDNTTVLVVRVYDKTEIRPMTALFDVPEEGV